MSRFIHSLQGLVRQRSGAVLLFFAIAMVLGLVPASQFHIDTGLERLMMRDDPERHRNREIKDEFSNDEILVVAFDLERSYQEADLRRLRDFSERVAAIDGVEEVLDLTTIEDVRGDGDSIDGSALIDFETLSDQMAALQRRIHGHRLYDRNLVSRDGEVLALLVVLELGGPREAINFRVSEALLELLETEGPGWPAYLSGYPFSEHDSYRLLTRDLSVLSSLALVFVLGFVYWITRRAFAVWLTLGLVLWTQVVSAAWFGATGTPFTIVTAILPTVLLATTCTYAVYLLGLLAHVSDDAEPGPALVAVLARPTLLASASTTVGFLALRWMPVEVLGQLGTGLAIGIGAAAIGSMVGIPAAIHRWELRLEARRLDGLSQLSQIGCRLAERPVATLAVAGVVVVLAGGGILRVRVDSDPLSYWKRDSYHRVSAEFVRNRLAGTLPINIVIHSGSPGGALEPEVVAFADALIRHVEESPRVDRTLSFLDYLFLMDAAMRPGEEPRTVLPSRPLAAQYLLLYELGGDPSDYRHYLNHDRSTLNVFLRLNDRSSSVALGLRDEIEDFAAAHAPERVEVEVLGTWLLFPKAMDGITRGMVQGLAFAVLAIGAVMLVSLRDPRLALVAAVPNLLPILICGGLLGWLGIPLSFATSIVGCVALGLAVDDTAHVLGHVRKDCSLESVYRTVGPALVLTTAALGCGFAILALSEFVPVVHLGLAATLTLVIALLCDLLLLPSLLVLIGYRAADPAPSARRAGERTAPAGSGAPPLGGWAGLGSDS